MYAIGGGVLQTEQMGTEQYVSLYPLHPFGDRSTLPPATRELLEPTAHLRFDPISACNARCVFCHTNFDLPVKHLALEDLAAVASHPMPALHTVAVGCSYEPLMGKYFERYPEALAPFRGRAKTRIITNGALLHKRDIAPWVEFGFEYLHVSMHSHISEVYEMTMRNGMSFNRVVQNIRDMRARFPSIRILFVNVVSKINNVDIGGYCRWAFDEIGVDQIVLFRATLAECPQNGAPAHQYLALYGAGGALNNDQWNDVVARCTPFMADACRSELAELGSSIATLTLNRVSRPGH